MNRAFRYLLASLLLALELTTPLEAQEDLPYTHVKDLIYGEIHGTGLLMDVFSPKEKKRGLGIIDVVSGAWSSDRGKIRDHTLSQMFTIYCSRGYTVFAVRPGSKGRYTVFDMDRNVKTAVRFIKEHATEYGIDPNRLVMTGASAGAHLATLAALTVDSGNPNAKAAAQRFDTSVKAVGVFFPPTDFLDWDQGKRAEMSLLGPLLFLGGASNQSEDEILAKAREASPLHRVTKTSVPFLLIHGDADRVVPISHSQKLVEAIKKSGGSADLMVKAGGGHPWLTIPEEVRKLADWFDKQLEP